MSSTDKSENQSRKYSNKLKFGIFISSCIVMSIFIFSGELHWLDLSYLAHRNYMKGFVNDCSTMRGFIQQDTWLKGTKDLQYLKQEYKDNNCGNPDLIPKEYSVIINADNIKTIQRSDIDFMHIPENHTVVIDCIVYGTSPNENWTKFDKMMTDHGCIMTSVNSALVGKWRYFN